MGIRIASLAATVSLAAALSAAPARASFISEILLTPAAPAAPVLPAYVEVHLTDPAAGVRLLVVDASLNATRGRILASLPLPSSPAVQVAAVGNWPGGEWAAVTPPANAQAALDPDAVNLTGARGLFLVQGGTGLGLGQSLLTDKPAALVVLDAVTYGRPGRYDALLGEPAFDLLAGQAMVRPLGSGGSPIDDLFLTDKVEYRLPDPAAWFAVGGVEVLLNPGLANLPWSHAPEPATALLLVGGMAGALLRRRPHGQPPCAQRRGR